MLPTSRKPNRKFWSDPFFVAGNGIDTFVKQLFGDEENNWSGVGKYPVDIHEDDNHLYVDAELPGFKKEDVDITLEDGVLSIAAEREVKADDDEKTRHLSERRFTKFSRRFTLPIAVDETNVSASLKDGVLHLTLPKREEVKARRIELA